MEDVGEPQQATTAREDFELSLAEALTTEPRDWAAAVRVFNEFELLAAMNPPRQDDESTAGNIPPYTAHMCALLTVGDLENARFLWKRIPLYLKGGLATGDAAQAAAAGDAELQAVWEIGKAMWNLDYAGVYRAADSFTWSDQYQGYVEDIISAFRERTVNLVAKAFSTISVANASELFGLSEDATRGLAAQRGWRLLDNVLVPVSPPKTGAQRAGLEELQRLTEYVGYLEGQN